MASSIVAAMLLHSTLKRLDVKTAAAARNNSSSCVIFSAAMKATRSAPKHFAAVSDLAHFRVEIFDRFQQIGLLVFVASDSQSAVENGDFDARPSGFIPRPRAARLNRVSRRTRALSILSRQTLAFALCRGQLLTQLVGCLFVDDGITVRAD